MDSNNNDIVLTKEEKRILDQRVSDLATIANTPEGARIFKSKLIQSMHPDFPIFTGNSHTFHNLGMKDVIDTELNELLKALGFSNYVELSIFLEKRV